MIVTHCGLHPGALSDCIVEHLDHQMHTCPPDVYHNGLEIASWEQAALFYLRDNKSLKQVRWHAGVVI